MKHATLISSFKSASHRKLLGTFPPTTCQTYSGPMELVVFDDGPSTDDSAAILEAYRSKLDSRGIHLQVQYIQ